MRGKRHGLSGAFAPLVLVLCFVIWMALLALGFGLMAYAARSRFRAAARSLPDAIYMVGSSIVTIGVSERIRSALAPLDRPRGRLLRARGDDDGGHLPARGAEQRRPSATSGSSSSTRRPASRRRPSPCSSASPRSATGASSRQALRDGRDWCATVRQSHSNHPSLIYFQSVGTGSGWPAALGALLDLALLGEQCLDDDVAARRRRAASRRRHAHGARACAA